MVGEDMNYDSYDLPQSFLHNTLFEQAQMICRLSLLIL